MLPVAGPTLFFEISRPWMTTYSHRGRDRREDPDNDWISRPLGQLEERFSID